MARPWQRKLEFDGISPVTKKKLVKVGNSNAMVLPKDWVRYRAEQDENGDYWVKANFDGDKFVIEGLK